MAYDLERLKRYMRIEHDEDDALIQSLADAADAYLTNAGISERGDPRRELALHGLVLHWYDNRAALAESTNPIELPLGLRQVINQLKFGTEAAT